jgi:F0F1-type ATP synthase assembly protein I
VPNEGEGLRAAARFLHLGWQLAITILLFTLGGYWLDSKYATQPWWTVTGATVGIIGALYSFIKTTIRQEQRQSDDGSHGGPGHDRTP